MEALAQRLGGEGSFTAKSGRGMDWSDALLFHHTDFGAAETTPAQADEGAALHEYSKYPTSARPPAARREYSSTLSSATPSSAQRRLRYACA